MLASFWEPDMSVLALALMVFVVLDVAMGRAWTIPIAVVLAVILVQGWATTAPIALALLGWAIVAFGFRWFDPGPRPRWIAPVIVSAAALVVLWIPSVVQQLRSNDGNLGLMVRFFRAPHAVLGVTQAYKLTSLQLGTEPPWAGAALPLRPFETVVSTASAPAVPILAVLFVVAVIFAAVRRDRSLALGLTVLVVIAAEIISLSRLIGDVFVEIMQPTWICGFGAALAAGWCLFSPLPDGLRRRIAPVLGTVLTVAVLGFGTANTVQAVQGPAGPPEQDRVLERLADPRCRSPGGRTGRSWCSRTGSSRATSSTASVPRSWPRRSTATASTSSSSRAWPTATARSAPSPGGPCSSSGSHWRRTARRATAGRSSARSIP